VGFTPNAKHEREKIRSHRTAWRGSYRDSGSPGQDGRKPCHEMVGRIEPCAPRARCATGEPRTNRSGVTGRHIEREPLSRQSHLDIDEALVGAHVNEQTLVIEREDAHEVTASRAKGLGVIGGSSAPGLSTP
jgi:hypothetical protein